ncbi:chaperonin 10-like protein [Phyllosticta citriasiana]|uniref:Chaperonin 10-like protein n=1 Tax=Phyllosticta citriasiana TaxID=595635 RepID=A0ABR1KCT4_9PEZI
MAPSAFADQPADHATSASYVFELLQCSETRTIAPPLTGELQIAIKATGLCGSDLSYSTKFRNGDGEGFRLGDRVAIGVGVPCDYCRSCQRGRYNLCPKMRFRRSAKTVPYFQGTLQDRINHPARVPDHVSIESVALLEPLAVAIHGTRIIADINVGRVKFALDHGFATSGYIVTDSSSTAKEDRIHAAARQLANDVVAIACADELNAEGGEVTFECTGKEVYMQAGLCWKKVDILGVFRCANTCTVGLKINSSGLLPNLDAMITHRVQGLQAARDAFELAARAADDDINLVLKIRETWEKTSKVL